MKTIWLFVNLQILAWCFGMTLAERAVEIVFPRDAYVMAGGSFLAGFLAFLWLSPKLVEFSSWLRIGSLLVFAIGGFYIATLVPLLQMKWGLL